MSKHKRSNRDKQQAASREKRRLRREKKRQKENNQQRHERGTLVLVEPFARFESFGPHKIVRPRIGVAVALQSQAATHLFAKFAPGTYTKPEKINEILQHDFAFYGNQLTESLKETASFSLMLHQRGHERPRKSCSC